MKQSPMSMSLFWFYIRFAMILIVLTSILAAIMMSVDINSVLKFQDLFQIL